MRTDGRGTRLNYRQRQTALLLKALLRRSDANTRALERQLRQLCYMDALLWRDWRLEYVPAFRGHPHYRLLYKERIVGIVDITTTPQWERDRELRHVRKKALRQNQITHQDILQEIQQRLAAYLDWIGFVAEETETFAGGAKASMYTKNPKLPKLFKLRGGAGASNGSGVRADVGVGEDDEAYWM